MISHFLRIPLCDITWHSRDCEKDRPAYIVFQLDKVLDVNKETSYFEWEELQADLEKLTSTIDVGLLKTISINFNRLLNAMLLISDVNLAKYRWMLQNLIPYWEYINKKNPKTWSALWEWNCMNFFQIK